MARPGVKGRCKPGSLSSCHSVRKMDGPPMLDTMTIRGSWPLRIALPGRRKVALTPGVRVWADSSGNALETVECSLPKVLFGHNGKVLETQSQLDAALGKLHGILTEAADMAPGPGLEFRSAGAFAGSGARRLACAGDSSRGHASCRLPRRFVAGCKVTLHGDALR